MTSKFIFTNIIGTFVFNQNYKIIDGLLFKDIEGYKNKAEHEETQENQRFSVPQKSEGFFRELKQKHKNLTTPDDKHLYNILSFFKIYIKSSKFDIICIF